MDSKLDKIIRENEPKHWSTRLDAIKQSQQDAELKGVTCHCDNCMSWSAGNKCVAEKIELNFGKNFQGETVCQCMSYTPAG